MFDVAAQDLQHLLDSGQDLQVVHFAYKVQTVYGATPPYACRNHQSQSYATAEELQSQ